LCLRGKFLYLSSYKSILEKSLNVNKNFRDININIDKPLVLSYNVTCTTTKRQQFSLWQNLCSKGNKGIEEMVSIINRIVGRTGISACPVADDRQECLSYRLISISPPYPFYHNENC